MVVSRNVVLLCLGWACAVLAAEFQCPGSANCTCSRGVSGDYELLCPTTLRQPTLIAQVLPNKYVQLQCTVMKHWEDLRLVSGLRIGPVNSFVLRLCPLPGMSFRELMRSVGVPATKTLQVQSHGNLSDNLSRSHLEGLAEVTQLNLNTNGLTALPEDLFLDMANLTWLDLKNNNVRLARGIFRPVPKLEVLELGSNNLTYIEPGLFRNLTKLRLLNLWGNRLQNLTRAVFSDVPNLESLDLNSNGLVTLTPDIFADLSKLKNLNLYANDFLALPQGLLLSTPRLEKFQIHNNRRSLRTLPSSLLANMTQLKEVHLNNCNLTQLPEDLLWGSPSVINLTLQKNLLTELPPNLLRDARELLNINLSGNRLVALPDALFANVEKLNILNLASNMLTSLSEDVFSSLRQLEVLNLSRNRLQHISPQAFQVTVNLKTIDLSHNQIEKFYAGYSDSFFGPHSLLHTCVNLEVVYLAHNNISQIFSDWQVSMTVLQLIDLSHNTFTNISIGDMQFTSTELILDLRHNNISIINLDVAERLAVGRLPSDKSTATLDNTAVRVLLEGNPLECDCRAYQLLRYFRGELAPEVNYIADFDGSALKCAGPSVLTGLGVKDVNPRRVVCSVNEDCPEGCACFTRPSDLGLLVDCSGAGLTSVPPSMPHSPHILNTTNHTELDLGGNRLRTLPHHLGKGYDRVTHLHLSDNNITSINITILSDKLQVLELNNNNITRLDTESIKMLQESISLQKITLHGNPWICDCDGKQLLNFVHSSFKKIGNLGNITCSGGAVLSKLTASELCPMTGLAWGVGSSVVALLGLLAGGLAALYYRYQREIKVWLYAHRCCLWLVTEEELDKDKLYDAFVSYSHQDEDFVVNKLVPGLEEGPTKFKLCLHYRDWIVGDFIPNQIARSVEDSRRTVVVLSPNFLESVWGRMEFRAAHSQALSEGRARVVVILYGDIGPTDKLDPELKAYLSMNTYVKWGDPWFWDKLRYALPHPPQLTKGIPLIARQSARRPHHDKATLVNGTAANAINTPPATAIIDTLTTLANSKPV